MFCSNNALQSNDVPLVSSAIVGQQLYDSSADCCFNFKVVSLLIGGYEPDLDNTLVCYKKSCVSSRDQHILSTALVFYMTFCLWIRLSTMIFNCIAYKMRISLLTRHHGNTVMELPLRIERTTHLEAHTTRSGLIHLMIFSVLKIKLQLY